MMVSHAATSLVGGSGEGADGRRSHTWIAPGDSLQVTGPDCPVGKQLKIEFEVMGGRTIGFDVMLELPGDEGGLRLYGPARRVQRGSVSVAPQQVGTVLIRWDNYSSWLSWRQVSYTILLSDLLPEEQADQGQSKQQADEDDDALFTAFTVPPGKLHEVDVPVTAGGRLHLQFDVLHGGDIDFAVMLEAADGSDVSRLYGPSHRLTSLNTLIAVPTTGTAHIGFDTSGGWFRSKVVRHACRCDLSDAC